MDDIPALDLWDLIVAVLGNTNQNDQVRGDPKKPPTRKKIHEKIDDLNNVDSISSNVNSSRKEALLYKPTELLLIGCLMESTWTQKSKSSTTTPKTNSQTY